MSECVLLRKLSSLLADTDISLDKVSQELISISKRLYYGRQIFERSLIRWLLKLQPTNLIDQQTILRIIYRLELTPQFFTVNVIQFLLALDDRLIFDLAKLFAKNPSSCHQLAIILESSNDLFICFEVFWLLSKTNFAFSVKQLSKLTELPFIPLNTDGYAMLVFKLTLVKEILSKDHFLSAEFVAEIQGKLNTLSLDPLCKEAQKLFTEVICSGRLVVDNPLKLIGPLLLAIPEINLESFETIILKNEQLISGPNTHQLINSLSIMGTATFLERSQSREDQFWTNAASVLVKHPEKLRNLSEECLGRLIKANNVPSELSFFVSIFNDEVILMNRINNNWLQRFTLHSNEKVTLLLSSVESLLDIKRIDKLTLVYSLMRRHLKPTSVKQYAEQRKFALFEILYNSGVRSLQAFTFILDRSVEPIEKFIRPNFMLLSNSDELDFSQDCVNILPFALIISSSSPQLFSNISSIFHDRLQLGVQDLSRKYFSRIVQELMSYFAVQFEHPQKAFEMIIELVKLLFGTTDNAVIASSFETCFLFFLYTANLLVQSEQVEEDIIVSNLTCLRIYNLLLKSDLKKYSNKISSFALNLYTRFKHLDVVSKNLLLSIAEFLELSDLIFGPEFLTLVSLAKLIQFSDKESSELSNAILNKMPLNLKLFLNTSSISEMMSDGAFLKDLFPILKMAESIPPCELFIEILGKALKDNLIIGSAIHSSVSDFLKDLLRVENASTLLIKRIQNLLTVIPCNSVRQEKESTGIKPFIKDDTFPQLCYDQLSCIKFSIKILRYILVKYTETTEAEDKNCLAYSIQELLVYLGLKASNCDIWDAFSESERNLLAPFLISKYKVNVNFDQISEEPLSLNSTSSKDWMWKCYLKVTKCFCQDPQTESFLQSFAALFLMQHESCISLLSSFIVSGLVRIEGFTNFFVQEFITVAGTDKDDIMALLLAIFTNIEQTISAGLYDSSDIGQLELRRIREAHELIPIEILAEISGKINKPELAIRFLEICLEYGDKTDEEIVKLLRKLYRSINQIETAESLDDFFSPTGRLKQISAFDDNSLMDSDSLKLKIKMLPKMQTNLSKMDASQILSSMAQHKNYEGIIEIVNLLTEKAVCSDGTLELLKESEMEACLALSSWDRFDEMYEDSFAPFGEPLKCSIEMDMRKAIRDCDGNDISLEVLRMAEYRDILTICKGTPLEDIQSLDLDAKCGRLLFRLNVAQNCHVEHRAENELRFELIKCYRKVGLYEKAFENLSYLQDLSHPDNCMLLAKLFGDQGNQLKAIDILNNFLESSGMMQDDSTALSPLIASKANLLIARYKMSSGHYSEKDILKNFETASRLSPQPKVHFHFAKFLDHDFGLLSLQEDEGVLKRAYMALKSYCRSLMGCSKYDAEAMPRLLTIWLDITANAKKQAAWGEKINLTVQKAAKGIQPLQFFKSLPQIISRIMHQHKGTFDLLQNILFKIFTLYPHSALWALTAVIKSSVPARQRKALDMLLKFRKDKNYGHLCKEYSVLTELLIGLANFKLHEGAKVLSLAKDFPNIKAAFPSQVCIPVNLHLANYVEGDNVVKIESILDRIEIIMSMQRPKKLSMRGSDGKTYTFLCKPNDDLRKDYRMMELIDLSNSLFKTNISCKSQPKLGIKRFTVTALNEEAGLVEWVPNTVSFRSIILNYYKRESIDATLKDLRINKLASSEEQLEFFTKELVPRFPLVMDRWMREKFADPCQWIEARNNFAISSACISMLGFITGLGDRHGENILIDVTSASCVHVDFNCLFDRGKSFEVPELVPFRLTRNMTAAMGISGWKGLFFKCSELSLQMFKDNKDLLQTNLESFIYDPMVEWTSKTAVRKQDGEVVNDQGLKIMETILRKISGHNDVGKYFPSSKSQALDLISEATDLGNLSKMYIGWSAFL